MGTNDIVEAMQEDVLRKNKPGDFFVVKAMGEHQHEEIHTKEDALVGEEEGPWSTTSRKMNKASQSDLNTLYMGL